MITKRNALRHANSLREMSNFHWARWLALSHKIQRTYYLPVVFGQMSLLAYIILGTFAFSLAKLLFRLTLNRPLNL